MQPTVVIVKYRGLLASALLVALLSACSSGSSNGTSDDGSHSNSAVNGYHLVRAVVYNDLNEVAVTRTYTYNFEANRIDVAREQTENDIPGVFVAPTSREFYDEQGRLTLRETPDDNGVRTNTYIFNSEGLLVSSETKSSFINYTVDFVYNAAGNLVSAVENSPADLNDPTSMTIVRTYSYSYDANGVLTSKDYEQAGFDSLNNKEVFDTARTTYSYNDQGQRIGAERVGFDTTFGDSMVEVTYLYDSNGNVSERQSYDQSGYSSRIEYFYETSPEPIFNFWLRSFKYFP